MGVDTNRADGSADNLVRHMVNSPRGPFEDLIRTAEDVDIVPEHNMLADLSDHLDREQSKAEDLGDAYNVYAQLQRVLQDGDVGNHYDVLLCDPPATESDHLYNAIYATRNLVIPVEPSWKGQASVEGLADLATNFADQLNIDVGVLAAIPNGVKNTSDQREMLSDIEFSTPEVIGDRTSLMEGCWKQQCSAFRYVREHRSRRREYEVETLAQLDRIARFLEAEVQLDAPNAPEPGKVEEPA
jgi:cellulose biosynthesis protein BcsQ